MERQKINGIETRRRGEIIEIRTEKGWKPTNDPTLLREVHQIELTDLYARWPVLYGV